MFSKRCKSSDTWKDFAYEARNYFYGWIIDLDICTFDQLKELIIVDQIKRRVPAEVREHCIDEWSQLNNVEKLSNNDDYPVMDSVQTVLSLYVNNASLRELWDIESLGIREPNEKVSKRKAFDEQLKEFHAKLIVLPDGRYEVELPWKLDARAKRRNEKR
ncbi:hypothetical protein AVEN_1093-1 [Araneus ventricosus]|uniref:Uncharacterized protein n=1 Tax=Araneus ventricosus TaxID=182803 RepID=A0A4Y2TM31_ARAVE|nr:hypothetical protein AVEN_1093-1 [Araneus ventricosus]